MQATAVIERCDHLPRIAIPGSILSYLLYLHELMIITRCPAYDRRVPRSRKRGSKPFLVPLGHMDL